MFSFIVYLIQHLYLFGHATTRCIEAKTNIHLQPLGFLDYLVRYEYLAASTSLDLCINALVAYLPTYKYILRCRTLRLEDSLGPYPSLAPQTNTGKKKLCETCV